MIPEQCRAARKALGWNQMELERRAGVSTVTISFFEQGKRRLQIGTEWKLRVAFKAAGVDVSALSGLVERVREG